MKKHDFSKEKAFSSSLVIFIDQRNRFSYFIRTALLILLLLSGTLLKAQQISLSLQKVPLSKAILELRKLTKYDFVYNDDLLKKVGPVSIHVKNATLEEALREMFENKPISFQVSDGIIILKERKGSISQDVNPVKQSEPIKGMIFDESGKALSGATIQVKGTSVVTVSDHTGSFELPGEYKNSKLVISFLGYRQIEVEASNARRIILTASAQGIDEITMVASGYQSIPKERATGSYAIVDNTLFNMKVSPNVIDRLEGNVPGLIFHKNTSSSTENGVDINIRGHSTLFASDQPLIILDNFPYDGDLGRINPNDIESISILKDAAATSIWGAKSGNGVIVVTTKKGKRNQKPSIELNSNVTVGAKPDVYYNKNFINAKDFISIERELFNRGFYNNDLASLSMPVISPVIDILDKEKRGMISSGDAEKAFSELRNVDVRKEIEKYFYQKSVNQQYSLNIRGGGDMIDYFVSLGADHNKSNLVGNTDSRFRLFF